MHPQGSDWIGLMQESFGTKKMLLSALDCPLGIVYKCENTKR